MQHNNSNDQPYVNFSCIKLDLGWGVGNFVIIIMTLTVCEVLCNFISGLNPAYFPKMTSKYYTNQNAR